MGVDFTNVVINTTDIFIFAGIILAALGAIWGIRKMIYLGNGGYDPDEVMNNGRPPDGWYDENNVLHTYEGHEDEYNDWLGSIGKDD